MKSPVNDKRQYKKVRCHYCTSNYKDRAYVICSSYPVCLCGFCLNCLKEVFKIDVKDISNDWICFVCKGICQCKRCLEKRTNRLLSESREIGSGIVFKDAHNHSVSDSNFQKRKRKGSHVNDEEIDSLYVSPKPFSECLQKTHTQPNLINIPPAYFFNQLHSYSMLYPVTPQLYFMPPNPIDIYFFKQMPCQSLLPNTSYPPYLSLGNTQNYNPFVGSSCITDQALNRETPPDEPKSSNKAVQETKKKKTQNRRKGKRNQNDIKRRSK